jgi:Tol biopolymer transport system component
VGLLVAVLYAQPAEANFPGKPGKIAYAGFDGQDYEIYTIKPGGGGRLNVTDNAANDRDPDYAPSGMRIAYASSATGTDNEILTINPGGGGRLQVTDNANIDRDPYWGSQ